MLSRAFLLGCFTFQVTIQHKIFEEQNICGYTVYCLSSIREKKFRGCNHCSTDNLQKNIHGQEVIIVKTMKVLSLEYFVPYGNHNLWLLHYDYICVYGFSSFQHVQSLAKPDNHVLHLLLVILLVKIIIQQESVLQYVW